MSVCKDLCSAPAGHAAQDGAQLQADHPEQHGGVQPEGPGARRPLRHHREASQHEQGGQLHPQHRYRKLTSRGHTPTPRFTVNTCTGPQKHQTRPSSMNNSYVFVVDRHGAKLCLANQCIQMVLRYLQMWATQPNTDQELQNIVSQSSRVISGSSDSNL